MKKLIHKEILKDTLQRNISLDPIQTIKEGFYKGITTYNIKYGDIVIMQNIQTLRQFDCQYFKEDLIEGMLNAPQSDSNYKFYNKVWENIYCQIKAN